jgi:hypothetical protein
LVIVPIIEVIVIIVIILQVNALRDILESTDSAQRKGHFALSNCLVLGHTKLNGVQRVYCNQFPVKPIYGSHRLAQSVPNWSNRLANRWRLF